MQDTLLRRIGAALPSGFPQRLCVAVSGGGDSLALLLLLERLAAEGAAHLFAVTVDHGLREGSAAEAASVARLCAGRGIPHRTLVWDGWNGSGNLQDAARRARYRLMADWARGEDIGAIALAHTLDDQAETVVMRLARGAGVDGLSAMAPLRLREGMTWLRPALGIRRAELRAFLAEEGIGWHEDPSNEDPRFERIRVRQALEQLEPLGITAETLARVAGNMSRARAALDRQTLDAARSTSRQRGGGLEIDAAGFADLPEEIARRLVAGALRWIGGTAYAARGRSLSAALDALYKEGSATLEGCRLLRRGSSLWIFREYNAVRAAVASPDALWDGRWRLGGAHAPPGLHVAALGPEGLAACPDWRATGLPRELLMASPGVWRGSSLLAAPVAGRGEGWTASLEKADAGFPEALITH